MLNNIIAAYNAYYNGYSGDKKYSIKELEEDLTSLNGDTTWIQEYKSEVEKVDDETRYNINKAIELIAFYLYEYGFEYECNKPPFNKGSLHSILKNGQAYSRIMLSTDIIEQLVDSLTADNSFPNINFGWGENAFDGEFYVMLEDGIVSREELIHKGVMTYLVGFPLSDIDILSKISFLYVRSETIMEAVVYESICEKWFGTVLKDLALYGKTVQEWCATFDGTWMDATNQIEDGFISIYNPINPKKVICISTLYPGEYFITNMLIFKDIYETGCLSTIRFVDRKVPVKTVARGNVEEQITSRVIRVPIFTDTDGEDLLLSDLVDQEYVYNEIFWRNAG